VSKVSILSMVSAIPLGFDTFDVKVAKVAALAATPYERQPLGVVEP
jgi:hypothetical protein